MLNRKSLALGDSLEGGGHLLAETLMKSYCDTLPRPSELSNLAFWPQQVLGEVDSRHLKYQHSLVQQVLKSYH